MVTWAASADEYIAMHSISTGDTLTSDISCIDITTWADVNKLIRILIRIIIRILLRMFLQWNVKTWKNVMVPLYG